jgi:hypothetical protein
VEVKLFGPVQAYVTPVVEELPVNVTLVVVQVRLLAALAVTAPGAVPFCDTRAVSVAVHPPAVTVKV